MSMKLIAALAFPVSMLMAQSGRPSVKAVTAIRHWSLSDVTRVAIEVSGEFEYRSDRLHNPERVYYDILNSHPKLDSHRFYAESLEDKLVQRIRVAENVPGMTRVVLDLSNGVEATASHLTNPDRLMIELRKGGAPSLTLVTPEPVAPRLAAMLRPDPPTLSK